MHGHNFLPGISEAKLPRIQRRVDNLLETLIHLFLDGTHDSCTTVYAVRLPVFPRTVNYGAKNVIPVNLEFGDTACLPSIGYPFIGYNNFTVSWPGDVTVNVWITTAGTYAVQTVFKPFTVQVFLSSPTRDMAST